MSSSWLSLYSGEGDPSLSREGPFGGLVTRAEAFRVMESGPRFDLIVFGCGLSGVSVAREAALKGAQVLLIEPGYPGEGACAWRESLVRELIRSPWSLVRSSPSLRHVMSSLAPHIATARTSYLSEHRGLGARLALRGLRSIASSLRTSGIHADIPDLDERLLIRELALAARQEGVFVMGATTAGYVERDVESGTFRVAVRDLLGDEQVVVRGGGIFVDPSFSQPLASRIGTPITKLSKAIRPHVTVVYSVEGSGDVGRVRHFQLSQGAAGTVCELQPGVVEVTLFDVGELAGCDMVSSAIPQLCEAAGYIVREEVSRRRVGSTYASSVSVENRRGILLPCESAPWKILRVVQMTLAYIESDGDSRRAPRALPGEWRGTEREEFVERAGRSGLSEAVIATIIERWQGRVRYLTDMERGLEEVCPGVLRGEIALAVVSDQVSSLEDLLFGSLALHTVPGWRGLVTPIAEALGETGAVGAHGLDVERVFAVMSVG